MLTDLEVEDMIGAHGLAAVFEELLYVHRDGESLQLGAALGKLAHPLRCACCCGGARLCPYRLSVYSMISLATNQLFVIVGQASL